MPTYQVASYRALWDLDNKKGRIDLFRIKTNGTMERMYGHHTDNVEEYELITDLLRNEKPVSFVTETRYIYTGLEPVGEEET